LYLFGDACFNIEASEREGGEGGAFMMDDRKPEELDKENGSERRGLEICLI
jgi:hypothetical protein